MKRNYLIFAIILIAALTLILSGCGREEQSIDGLCVTTFELEGGTLETPTSSVSTKINFAYHPGTYVLDPTKLNNYKLTKIGYDFTGWYTDKELTKKWDFNTVIYQEKLTLYAGWEESVNITYTVCYVNENGETVELGTYKVKSGAKFKDTSNYASTRKGYTFLNHYYSDPECQDEWDNNFIHPGKDTDLDVPVYVNYIEGTWALVDTLSAFKNAVSAGKNVYLLKDIDCGGATLSFNRYSGELNGNGYTVSNFKTVKSGSAIVSCSIFMDLLDGAIIRDVAFTGVTYEVKSLSSNVSKIKIAALAASAAGKVTITNVTVQGTVDTDYKGELPEANIFVSDVKDGAVLTVTGENNVDITIVVN